MKRPGRRIRLVAATGLVLAAYPAFVLGTVYAQWFRADLPGGRNGPSDAYRHSLASATVVWPPRPRWPHAAPHGEAALPMSAVTLPIPRP